MITAVPNGSALQTGGAINSGTDSGFVRDYEAGAAPASAGPGLLRVEFIGRHQAHRLPLPLMLARSLIPGTAASMASIVTAPEV